MLAEEDVTDVSDVKVDTDKEEEEEEVAEQPETVEIIVSDPQNLGEGRTKTTSYLVEVKPIESSLSPGLIPRSCVRRRYSDFRWLYNSLQVERAGAIIPILPHTHALTQTHRFSKDLIAERLVSMNRFLFRVVHHPELMDAGCLATFLRADNEAFESGKKEVGWGNGSDQGTEEEVCSSPREKIRHAIAKGVKAMAVKTGKAELEETEDDPHFRLIEEYVQNLDVYVKEIAKESKNFVSESHKHADTIEHLSKSLFSLSVTETKEEETVQTPADSNGDASDGLGGSAILRRMSDRLNTVREKATQRAYLEHIKFDEPMAELERDVQAVKLALQRRKDKQMTYTTRIQQIKNRQNALEKLRNNPKPGNEEKLRKTEADIYLAKDAAKSALEDLEKVSKRVMREMDRFKADMHEVVRVSLTDFAEVQIDFGHKMIEAWESTVDPGPKIEAV
mmetsp:Transcript_10717/g.15669  ORF Transcript_10717/g.15669 Transcript_10717/m.15669 type:complete len:449 (+) Transcript_10717:54-1400(+)|eukprot:CAMPEP_0195519828 /NCGR_PEP_ID=MMETSP0794_2-20130614/15578_1 /TAXON_ID=515487 /ORGANISM="Stephanopyxis turris, Strain CCMP 815" /LENGTH=448 /DNA_ID=CAMNT_0040649053 /DNA_START=40 /DNA_END=1386 /DNA_ORIENTATION=+